jgi:hypothetical protein
MTMKNRELILTREELIKMITVDNTDKNDWSGDTLVGMINSFKTFSDKQYNWLLSKVKYIVKHNKKYRNFRDIRGFEMKE